MKGTYQESLGKEGELLLSIQVLLVLLSVDLLIIQGVLIIAVSSCSCQYRPAGVEILPCQNACSCLPKHLRLTVLSPVMTELLCCRDLHSAAGLACGAALP